MHTVCVDINPAAVTKLADRGSFQTIGIVTDVGLFLDELVAELEGQHEAGERRQHANGPTRPARSKSLYLMLGGMVVAGAVGWWRWLRSARKY